MNPRSRFNLILFTVVTALAIFLLSTNKSKDNNPIIALSNIPVDSINHITIERADRDNIELARDNNQWHMIHPLALTANPTRINAILGILQTSSFAQLDINSINPEKLQLQSPVITLHLDNNVLGFGDTEPLDNRRYVQMGNTVHLIDDNLYAQLLQDAAFFVDTKLLPDNVVITKITFPDITLQKFGQSWSISPPVQMAQDNIINTIKAWQQTSAVRVSPYYPGKIQGYINIDTGQHGIINFAIIATQPTLILARPELGVEYNIMKYDAERLFLNITKTSTQN